MLSQKSLSSQTKNYRLHRMDLPSIVISLEQRDAIIVELQKGSQFVLVKDHVVMLNNMTGIDPIIEKDKSNMRPKPEITYKLNKKTNGYQEIITNQAEIDKWDEENKKIV